VKKKGQAIQFLPYLLIGLVFVVVLAIFAIPVTHIGDKVFDELKENEIVNVSDEGVSSISQVQSMMTKVTDQMIFFLLGALLLGFIAIAMFSDFHPIILGALILFIILMVILGGVMVNVVDEVENTDVLINKSSEFTLTNQVLGENLPMLIIIFGAIAVIILLAKRGKVVSPV